MIFLRASAMPMAFKCPGSVRRDGLLVDESHPSAGLGTAVHEALRSLVETGRLDWDAIPQIAKRYGADEQDVRMLCAHAAKLWLEVRDSFPDALTEVRFSGELSARVTLTGHVDLLATRGSVARVADFKTGFQDSDYSHQMRAYGTLVLLDNPELTEVTVTVLWIRDASAETYTMTRDDAAAWVKRLLAHVLNWDGVYRPGSHCQYCPRSTECEAANAFVRRDIAAMTDRELVSRAECDLAAMTPERIIELEQKASLVSAYASRVRAAIRSHVAANGDVVANGVRLTIATEEHRQLDPLKAFPVLEAAGFGDAEFAECVEIRPSKVDNIVAKRAPRGKGAAKVRELKAQLEEAGATSVKQIQKLTTRRA